MLIFWQYTVPLQGRSFYFRVYVYRFKHFYTIIVSRMSRFYDNQPLKNLPVINVDHPRNWTLESYIRYDDYCIKIRSLTGQPSK